MRFPRSLNPGAAASKERWLALGALVFLAAVPVFLFLPGLLSGGMLYGYDVVAVHASYRVEIARSLAAGQWPLWMPDILGGMPGIAACNFYFLYPSDLIATLAGWPLRTQFGLDAICSVALAGIGMFLFLRRLGRSVPASLLGAFFFAVSGSEVSQLFGGYYSFLEGVALVPWAFWAAHKGCVERSRFAWGLCGLAFALQVLSLSIQLFAYTLPAVAAFVLALEWGGSSAPGPAKTLAEKAAACLSGLQGLGLALVLALLLSAPQFWPALRYLPLSTRSQGWTRPQFLEGSIGLGEALAWIVPGAFGWHSPTYHGSMADCFTSEYFGLLPWALAVGAFFALWRREALVRWMAALALAALFFAQGTWAPFYPVLRRLPVLSGFRIWSRDLFLLTFAMCTVAAFGWDALRAPARRKAALSGATAFAVLALGAAALAWIFARRGAETGLARPVLWEPTVPPREILAALTAMTRESARGAMAFVLFLPALLWFGAGRKGAAVFLVLALAFHALDQDRMIRCFVGFMAPRDVVSRPKFTLPPPAPAGAEPWRIYDHDISYPNESIFWGYENLEGRESMSLESYGRIREAMRKRRADWCDLMNERYFFSHSTGTASGDAVMIYENFRAFPRAWLVDRVLKVSGDEQAYRLLADPSFKPRVEVALPEDPAPAFGPGSTGEPRGGVTWLDRSPQTCDLDVSTDRDAVLVLSNAWYPAWRCAVDGRDTRVLKADGGLQAVVLRAGRHRVEFRFDDGLFDDALAASLVGLLFLVGLGWMEYGKGRRAGGGAGEVGEL